jgi:putative methyltransferase (TIGR04325 family)
MRDLRSLLRDVLPPFVLRATRRIRGAGLVFSGDYATWDAALAGSSGYDADAVLDRAFDAARAVTLGEAAFERDGVVFDEPDYAFPVLAALLRVASTTASPLRVLDIGGAFGSSARQLEAFAPHVRTDWRIVEQPAFVERGAKHFSRADLQFFTSVEEAVRDIEPHAVLLSSSLQYFEQPYALLQSISALGWRALIVDRTPTHDAASDRLTVQRVPPSIYDASYPCWVFSERRLRSAVVGERGRIAATWSDEASMWRHDSGPFRLWGALVLRDASDHVT